MKLGATGGFFDDAGVGLPESVLEFTNQVILFSLKVKEPFEVVQSKSFNGLYGQGAGLLAGLGPSHAVGDQEQVPLLIAELCLGLS